MCLLPHGWRHFHHNVSRNEHVLVAAGCDRSAPTGGIQCSVFFFILMKWLRLCYSPTLRCGTHGRSMSSIYSSCTSQPVRATSQNINFPSVCVSVCVSPGRASSTSKPPQTRLTPQPSPHTSSHPSNPEKYSRAPHRRQTPLTSFETIGFHENLLTVLFRSLAHLKMGSTECRTYSLNCCGKLIKPPRIALKPSRPSSDSESASSAVASAVRHNLTCTQRPEYRWSHASLPWPSS